MRNVPNLILKNANVIPMNENTVLYNRDVCIENGRIIRIYASGSVADNGGRTIIDCTGKYVMPALWDAHVHVFNDEFLTYLLSWGVTTAVNMWGFPKILRWKKQIAAGLRAGPDLYTASPIIDSLPTYPLITVATTAAEAEKAVLDAKRAGYDFIKIYNNLTPEVYAAVAETADRLNIRVLGHLPNCNNTDYTGKNEDYPILQDSVEHVLFLNENNLARMAAQGVWLDPTFTVEDTYRNGPTDPALGAIAQLRRGLRKIDWRMLSVQHKRPRKNMQKTVRKDPAYYDRMFRAYLKAGGNVVLGTDAGFPNIVPGFSLHQELAAATEHGMSNYEALRAATLSAAEFLGVSADHGTIEAGKEAQLLILNANPLDDINATLRIHALLLRTQFYTAEALHSLREIARLRPGILVGSVFRGYAFGMVGAFFKAMAVGTATSVGRFFARVWNAVARFFLAIVRGVRSAAAGISGFFTRIFSPRQKDAADAADTLDLIDLDAPDAPAADAEAAPDEPEAVNAQSDAPDVARVKPQSRSRTRTHARKKKAARKTTDADGLFASNQGETEDFDEVFAPNPDGTDSGFAPASDGADALDEPFAPAPETHKRRPLRTFGRSSRGFGSNPAKTEPDGADKQDSGEPKEIHLFDD